jgi:hypothetical protein
MTVDNDRNKWLARAGENFFSDACNNSMLTASSPKHDENGWDFIVEFPQNRFPMVRMDAQHAPIKFFCQVKATDHFADRKKELTVSNWENLARNALPSFILIVDYDGHDEPQEVYLCHVGKERIGQTLRRIRELDAENKRELHKHRLMLTASEDEQVNTACKTWVKDRVTLPPVCPRS